jgi:hypothetical protein
VQVHVIISFYLAFCAIIERQSMQLAHSNSIWQA